MNKTKIEYVNYSWNPVTGCEWNCWYCYAKRLFTRFHRSFKPIFYPERLNEPSKLKKPSRIFCCSVSDLFADWTKPKWREAILNEIKKYPQHTFLLLTKQPQGIDKNYNFGKNVWIGVTINSQDELNKIDYLRSIKCGIRFISFEPLLENIPLSNDDLKGIDWIIIGKLTGSKKVKLQEFWVEDILNKARDNNIPVFIKNNVNWKNKIQNFPYSVGMK